MVWVSTQMSSPHLLFFNGLGCFSQTYKRTVKNEIKLTGKPYQRVPESRKIKTRN